MTVPDPRAKRPQENHLQWHSRVARLDQDERDRNEPIVPLEAEQHGDYVEGFVMHIETRTTAHTKRNRIQSPIAIMHMRGALTDEEHEAALEIARVVELIESAVSVRGASLEARVDNSGSGRDLLFERLSLVRLEATYSIWRNRLPMPRRMIIDMIVMWRPLVATARSYGVPWRMARKRMINALNLWIKLRNEVRDMIEEREVEVVYHKLGSGCLIGTMPKVGVGAE